MELQFLTSIILFMAFVFAQAVLINGIRTSMAGSTEKMPNGKDRDTEEIFYPFFKFITQSYIKRVYYEGAEFKKFKELIYEKYIMVLPVADNKDVDAGYLKFNTDEEVKLVKQFAIILLREMQVHTDIDGRHVRFYKEYEEYKFSKWWRKPWGQCIKCMASVYSVIPYWTCVVIAYGFQWWHVPVYIVNVFCLVHANYLLYKK